MAKILIVDDDKDVVSLISRKLVFDKHICDTAHNGVDGLHLAKASSYDLLILDWELPGMSGPEICKALRDHGSDARVLFLTGRSDLNDKETGFIVGGDDYLTKPFHIRELSLRVDALLRRQIASAPSILVAGPISIDSKAHSASVSGEPVDLTAKEFALLELFMKNQNMVFSPDTLIEKLWSTTDEVTPSAVRTLLKQLRKKLGTAEDSIQNVYGAGYKFVALGEGEPAKSDQSRL